MTPTQEQLLVEQKALDDVVFDLMKDHAGQWVLFKDKKPVDFFHEFSDAYSAGLERFGFDEVFLISEVRPPQTGPVSLTWELGVL